MSEENKEGKVLIEETDVGRHRRENPEPEPKKKKVSGWLIATIAVLVVGIVAGLAVYFVQQKRDSDVYVRTVSVTTDKATMTTTEEEDFEIEDSDDIVIAGDDAIGGDLEAETETTSDEKDDKTKKTTKRTTRRKTSGTKCRSGRGKSPDETEMKKAVGRRVRRLSLWVVRLLQCIRADPRRQRRVRRRERLCAVHP